MKRALSAFRSEAISPGEESAGSGSLATRAYELWDDETWHAFSVRLVELARDAGALTGLPIALDSLASMELFAGNFAEAASLIEEGRRSARLPEADPTPYGPVLLAACQGREAAASELIEASMKEVVSRGEGWA